MKNIIILAIAFCLMATPVLAQFGADVGLSKVWIETDDGTTSINGAVPGINYTHAFSTLVYEATGTEPEREVPGNGLTFGWGNLSSSEEIGAVNAVFGRYFHHWKGMEPFFGVQADFIDTGTLVDEYTTALGVNLGLKFPSLVADKLPFQVSGSWATGIGGSSVDVASFFIGFNGTL